MQRGVCDAGWHAPGEYLQLVEVKKTYARAMIVVVVGADVWVASPVPRGVGFREPLCSSECRVPEALWHAVVRGSFRGEAGRRVNEKGTSCLMTGFRS